MKIKLNTAAEKLEIGWGNGGMMSTGLKILTGIASHGIGWPKIHVTWFTSKYDAWSWSPYVGPRESEHVASS